MRYQDRRKQETITRDQRPPERVFVDRRGPAVPRLAQGDREQVVPLRLSNQTVRHVRVRKLQANLEHYARELALTIPELEELITARRYTPAPAPKGVELRAPGWYVSDNYTPFGIPPGGSNNL